MIIEAVKLTAFNYILKIHCGENITQNSFSWVSEYTTHHCSICAVWWRGEHIGLAGWESRPFVYEFLFLLPAPETINPLLVLWNWLYELPPAGDLLQVTSCNISPSEWIVSLSSVSVTTSISDITHRRLFYFLFLRLSNILSHVYDIFHSCQRHARIPVVFHILPNTFFPF